MYLSYFEFKKILSRLEKEYIAQAKDDSPQNNKKFGAYAAQALRRTDKEVKDYLQKKYKENS